MSFIINIPGKERYNLPECTIEPGPLIRSWNKYKKFLFLSDPETIILLNMIKSDCNVSAKEQITKQGLCLTFNKPINSNDLNDVLRKFVKLYKQCTYCNIPEVVDYSCRACGKQLIDKSN